jgi:hypothetical protein
LQQSPEDGLEIKGRIKKRRDRYGRMRIPVKLDSDSGGKWTPVPVQSGQHSERSDAGVGL